MTLVYLSNFGLLLFNFLSFVVGSFFIVKNYEDLNKSNGIHDCYNVFLLCGLGVINNLIPLMGCSRVYELNIIAFITSASILSYNSYNLSIINTTCSSYYYKNYKEIWYYYNASISIQIINILLYSVLFFTHICKPLPIKKSTNSTQTQTQTQPLIDQSNTSINSTTRIYPNIYECDSENLNDNDNTVTI